MSHSLCISSVYSILYFEMNCVFPLRNKVYVLCFPELEPCMNLNCQNGGQCVNDQGVYMCSCPDSWTGTFCETGKTCPDLFLFRISPF